VSTITFVVPDLPVSWSRAGRSGKRSYTTPEQTAWRLRVLAAARRAAPRAPDGPLEVSVVGVWPRPQRRPDAIPAELWAYGGRLLRVGDPDVDNLAKGILDALQLGVLPERRWLGDDNRVVRLEVLKVYGQAGEAAHTEVQIIAWDHGAWVQANTPLEVAR
jgi:Holliday junction resolvase RusA-like endonuclease